jgi:ferritin-like metal-binding protein YciE
MEGLKSAHTELRDKTPQNRRDLVVASAAAATEHAEIAAYDAIRTIADAHGNTDAVELVDRNLAQERHALELAQHAEKQLSVAHAGDGPA